MSALAERRSPSFSGASIVESEHAARKRLCTTLREQQRQAEANAENTAWPHLRQHFLAQAAHYEARARAMEAGRVGVVLP